MIKDLEQQILEAIQFELEKTAADIYKEALRLVPVDSGALKESIEVIIGDMEITVTAGNQDIDYADYVEFGTINQKAQPFLTPAFESN
jgi:HK97 gp10 family phage protein